MEEEEEKGGGEKRERMAMMVAAERHQAVEGHSKNGFTWGNRPRNRGAAYLRGSCSRSNRSLRSETPG